MTQQSALYVGSVMHQRLRPLRHRLRYRVFSLLLDVDELPVLSHRLRLFSLNRFNVFSLHERDYGEGDGRSLREQVDARLLAAGLQAGGPIRLLSMPRILGYAFNPLSVYFCHRPGGELQAILYEVNNTFGERHRYLLEVDPSESAAGLIRQECDKALHVSPFLALHMRYRFRVRAPSPEHDQLRIGVTACDGQGALLLASFGARRHELGDLALARAFLSIPLLTFKVVLAIHWEALRLWWKGVPVFSHAPREEKHS